EREERKAQIVVISNRAGSQQGAATSNYSALAAIPGTIGQPAQAVQTPKATPRTHRLPEGTLIDAVLINALDGEFSGPVECLVTTPVLADDRRTMLIPAGARVLGKASRVDAQGQQRLAVTFHRIEFPNGTFTPIESATALNQTGETGLRDKVDHHWPR